VNNDPEQSYEEYWQSIQRQSPIKALEVIKESAKQLIAITSTLQGIYFATIAISDLKKVISGLATIPFAVPVALWLLSLYLAIKTLAPESQGSIPKKAEDIEKVYLRLVEDKYHSLKLAQWILGGSLFFLMLNILFYLAYLPAPPPTP